MYIGILGDIHGNAHALDVVLKSAKEKNVEKLLCTGDYVGYYYEPDKVMAMLNEWDWVGVSGNHEGMLLDWKNGKKRKKIEAKYGSGIAVAAKKLSEETISHLCSLPHTKKINIEGYKIVICHGSPWDRDIYIYPDADENTINELFSYNPDFDLLIYGHTHYPVKWERGRKKIINPGSVGQPRDRGGYAGWAILSVNTDSIGVQLQKTKYDVSRLLSDVKTFDQNNKYLYEVLVR